MDSPLQVLAGEDGIFQDVHHRPMIMVFKSTHEDVPANDESRAELKANAGQEATSFAFVQVSGSKMQDKDARTMIRTHVMQDHFRRKRQKTPQSRPFQAKVSSTSIQASVVTIDNRFQLCSLPPQPAGSLDPFAQYPIEMNPQTYLLVHHYLTTIVPFAQPSDFGWDKSFASAMRDSALFHIVLVSAAVHINFANYKFTTPDTVYHKLKAIQTVNEKLQHSPAEVSDEMIHVVMFMAMTEGVIGDNAAANSHIDGLARMVENRGGFSALSYEMQHKISLADYLCCVEPDRQPRFKFRPSSSYPILDRVAASSVEVPIGFRTLSCVVNLDQEYLDILIDIEHFCTSFRLAYTYENKKTLKPHDYDVTSLRYRLLDMKNARRLGTPKELVQEACRVGTLVFMKTVFDQFGCWGPSHKVWGGPYRFVVEKLKVFLTRLDQMLDNTRTEYLELLLWLSFMGGVLQLEYANRQWYNAQIAMIAAKLGLHTFDEVKVILTKFLWVDWVHEMYCAELWADVWTEAPAQKVGRNWGIGAQSLRCASTISEYYMRGSLSTYI